MEKRTLRNLAFLAIFAAAPSGPPCHGGANEKNSPRPNERSVEDLVRQLGSPSYEKREQASAALIQMGAPALKALRGAENGDDPEVARRARACVAGIERQMKIDSLMAALRGANPETRHEAASSLLEMGRAAALAVPALVAALDHPDSGVREKATLVLRSIGPDAEPAVPKLVAIVKNKKETTDLRWCAAIALGEIPRGWEQSLPVFLQLAEDKEPLLRNAAAHGLGNLGRDGKRVVPVLIKLLDDPDLRVQGPAAGGLGSFPAESTSSVRALVRLLNRNPPPRNDPSDPRGGALGSLGKLGAPAAEAVPAILAICENPMEDLFFRMQAIRALGKMGPEAKAAVAALRRLADKPDLYFIEKKAIADALGGSR